MNAKGATLVEIIMSLAIGSIVMASVADISVGLIRQKFKFETSMGKVFDASLIFKNIHNKVYMGGGNGMSPWQSIAVENNCSARDWFPDCMGTDRLTVATNRIEYVSGKKRFVNSLPYFNFDIATGNVAIMDPAAVGSTPCPLDDTKEYQHILITDRATSQIAVRWVTGVNTSTCILTTAESTQGQVLTKLTGATTSLLNSTIYLVDLTTYYLDPEKKQIKALTKKTQSADIETNEETVLAEGVYDFQVSLGYDVGIKNMVISDLGNDVDEVLYNSATDTFDTLGGGGALESDLQALMVAFTVGHQAENRKDSIQNFDGPTVSVSDTKLLRFNDKFTFRNLSTFQ